MPWCGPEVPGEFPTLGYLVAEFIETHCVIPDGDHAGEPFRLTDPQLRFALDYYRLKPEATAADKPSKPFHFFRGGQLVEPVKWGKSPFGAAMVCGQAEGPVLFDGWADSAGHVPCPCGCGRAFRVNKGDPIGRPWSTPLIQVTATSESQTDNVWRALMPMIAMGPLGDIVTDVGETRINLPSGGRIEPVTSSARARLGQRVTFTIQEETHAWQRSNGGVNLKDTQRRNLAGTSGRFLELTNAWDPAEESAAQQTAESTAAGVHRHHSNAGAGSIRNARDRRRMIKKLYRHSWWIDQDRIEGEALELLDRDPAQAERFFLNRIVASEQSGFDVERWKELAAPDHKVADKAHIVIAVDGARFDDALAIVATEVESGFQRPIGIWEVPAAAGDDYEHPDSEVDGAMIEAFETYSVGRVYVDPDRIEHLLDRWQGRWGADVVVAWYTNRPRQFAHACRNYRDAMTAGDISHSGDETMTRHIGQAVRRKVNVFDDDRRQMWTIGKDRPGSPRKMDAAAAGVMSWEARGDAIAAGAKKRTVDRRLRIG